MNKTHLSVTTCVQVSKSHESTPVRSPAVTAEFIDGHFCCSLFLYHYTYSGFVFPEGCSKTMTERGCPIPQSVGKFPKGILDSQKYPHPNLKKSL